jgi:hypothetical protein
MVIFIGKKRLLACTAGQTKHDIDSFGVTIEDMEEFMRSFMECLPKGAYVSFDSFDDRTYYNEDWMNEYFFFQQRYRVRYDTIPNGLSHMNVDLQLRSLKTILERELESSGLTDITGEEIVDKSVSMFRKYYQQKYGENLLEDFSKDKPSVLEKKGE